jgi:hypothetical protein
MRRCYRACSALSLPGPDASCEMLIWRHDASFQFGLRELFPQTNSNIGYWRCDYVMVRCGNKIKMLAVDNAYNVLSKIDLGFVVSLVIMICYKLSQVLYGASKKTGALSFAN